MRTECGAHAAPRGRSSACRSHSTMDLLVFFLLGVTASYAFEGKRLRSDGVTGHAYVSPCWTRNAVGVCVCAP